MIRNNKKFIIGLIAGVVLVALITSFSIKDSKPSTQNNNSSNTPAKQTPVESQKFDKTRYSTTDPTSIWVIVNKKLPLPAGYVPGDLTDLSGGAAMRADAAKFVQQLIDGAKNDGVHLKTISAYRSYSTQRSVYDAYVKKDGQAAADTYSARPGHSEHQTGLAADLGNSDAQCDLEICFANTTGGKWLADHAQEYGFTIRYQQSTTQITGYQYEPWHIRYVGKDLATELNTKKQTMEEFFGLAAAPGY